MLDFERADPQQPGCGIGSRLRRRDRVRVRADGRAPVAPGRRAGALVDDREFGFVRLGEGYCSGSSLMPQKRNLDIAELLRGKPARVIGDVVALLTISKGLTLAYNKDLQESQEPLYDAVETARQVAGGDARPGHGLGVRHRAHARRRAGRGAGCDRSGRGAGARRPALPHGARAGRKDREPRRREARSTLRDLGAADLSAIDARSDARGAGGAGSGAPSPRERSPAAPRPSRCGERSRASRPSCAASASRCEDVEGSGVLAPSRFLLPPLLLLSSTSAWRRGSG